MNAAIDASDKKNFILWLGEIYPELSESARGRLLEYGEMVAEAGDRMGLVSRGDVARVYMRHVRESLAPALMNLLPRDCRVADVGSGGGFPGIPVAIVREDLTVGLVEPRHRKGAFLDRAVLRLGLANTTVYTASIDALVRDNPELHYDVAVSRGLGWTSPMLRRLKTLLNPGGVLLRYGSPDFAHPMVDVIPLDEKTPRAIQVWPAPAWKDIPTAP